MPFKRVSTFKILKPVKFACNVENIFFLRNELMICIFMSIVMFRWRLKWKPPKRILEPKISNINQQEELARFVERRTRHVVKETDIPNIKRKNKHNSIKFQMNLYLTFFILYQSYEILFVLIIHNIFLSDSSFSFLYTFLVHHNLLWIYDNKK